MIDYNRDIAPLQQQYFPMITGERGFDLNMKYRQDVLMPLQQHTMKMQQHQMQMQQREMEHKIQKMNLRKIRDDFKQRRALIDAKPMIEARMEEIRTSEATPTEKREAFSKFTMDNMEMISRSPFLAKMFEFQDTLFSNQIAAEAQAKQKQQSYFDTVAKDYREGTYGTQFFDEDVYQGILSGQVSDQDISDTVAAANEFKAAKGKKSEKEEEPPHYAFAKRVLPLIEKMETTPYQPSDSEAKNRVFSEGKMPPVLKEDDYVNVIDYYLRVSGEPINKESRARAKNQYPLTKSRALLDKVREDLYHIMSVEEVGQPSYQTIKGRENTQLIDSVTNQTP